MKLSWRGSKTNPWISIKGVFYNISYHVQAEKIFTTHKKKQFDFGILHLKKCIQFFENETSVFPGIKRTDHHQNR